MIILRWITLSSSQNSYLDLSQRNFYLWMYQRKLLFRLHSVLPRGDCSNLSDP